MNNKFPLGQLWTASLILKSNCIFPQEHKNVISRLLWHSLEKAYPPKFIYNPVGYAFLFHMMDGQMKKQTEKISMLPLPNFIVADINTFDGIYKL